MSYEREAVVWENGKPVYATPKEAKRIMKRLEIIIAVLETMGYSDASENWNEHVTQMAQDDFKKYMEFLDEVQKMAKKEGC